MMKSVLCILYRAVASVVGLAGASLVLTSFAVAGTTPGKAQVLFAITNSQSMDGTVSGAIMTGSGTAANLGNSSSPQVYTPAEGFTPPLQAANSAGNAPYTVVKNQIAYDNSDSRMNMAKSAMQGILSKYLSTIDFALSTYSTASQVASTTWVYYMSPPGGFTFSKSPQTNAINVSNPCYGYTTASYNLKSACGSIASNLYGTGIAGMPYMQVSATSDASNINDVLYSDPYYPVFVVGGGHYPETPYPPFYSAYDYSQGKVSISYQGSVPGGSSMTFTPTNAGYTGYSSQVMFAQRGFGFGTARASDLSATSGDIVLPMQTTGPLSTSASNVSATLAKFSPFLAPESNSEGSSEIKAVAGQSPVAGLLSKANAYLASTKNSSCAGQYVVLITDGLPTMSLNRRLYPPLGSYSAQQYGITATFNADGSLATTNDPALSDAIAAVSALAQKGVKTFVVGVGAGVDPSVNPMAAKTLTALAVAGGTNLAYSASSQAALNGALSKIFSDISASSAVSSPIAPLSLSKGSLVYTLTSDASPLAAHVRAFSVGPTGTVGTTSLWDAAALMTPLQRQALLLSSNASGASVAVSDLDSSAFNLSPTACVPNVSTIKAYLADPGYTLPLSNGQTCTYLAGRADGASVGPLDPGNSAALLSPSSNALLLAESGYLAYAKSTSSRPTQLVFTSSDGVMYSVDSQSGKLLWGWMPRPFASAMQNISSVFSQGLFDGGFVFVDAKDSSGAWGTYIVGTAQSGAYHYAVKLDSSGKPSQVVWSELVPGAVSPAGQAPVVVRSGASVYAVYVRTANGQSTLVEQPLTGGNATSSTLPFDAASTLTFSASSGFVYLGDSTGKLWQLPISGNANQDTHVLLTAIGSAVVNAPALYVGTGFVNRTPVAWIATQYSLTLYSKGGSGWSRLWSSTAAAGTFYGGTTSQSNSVQRLPSNAQVSGSPVLAGNVLSVPVYEPPASNALTCGGGVGSLMFFNPLNGSFSTGNVRRTSDNTVLTGSLTISQGQAFSPTVSLNSQGVTLLPGGQSSLIPENQLQVGNSPVSTLIQWAPAGLGI